MTMPPYRTAGASPLWAFVLVLTALALPFGLPALGVVAGEAEEASEARMLDDITYLASDDLEGRGIDTEGIVLAGEYIAQEFAEAGLNVQVQQLGGEPFQPFTVVDGAELGEPNRLVFHGPDGPLELQPREDFLPMAASASAQVRAPLAFVGYGITAPEYGYDDYEGIDVQGRIVIVMRREPQQADPHSTFNGTQNSSYADLASKLSTAFQHGAAGVIFVTEPHSVRQERNRDRERVERAVQRMIDAGNEYLQADEEGAEEDLQRAITRLQDALARSRAEADPLMEFGYGGLERRPFVVLHATQDAVNRVLEAALRTDLASVERKIDQDLEPQSALLEGWEAEIEANLNTVEHDVRNVVAVLEGEGPHADETIIIGAHYDHLGYGGQGSLAPDSRDIHNGADDNASGTVSIIELARRFAARSEPLPRRLVFIAFSAEERGLLGSAHYVRNPVFPLEQTVAMVNLDMVGRLTDDKLLVYGTGTATGFEELIQRHASEYGFNLTLHPEGVGPSDHASFYRVGIPVLHFFTDLHNDYHRPTDDVERINVPGMRRVADMIEDVVLEIATADERPEFVQVEAPSQSTGGDRPYFGSIPDFGAQAEGYAIQGVSPESPAAEAGLEEGDVIVRLGEYAIGNLEDFDAALRRYEAGDEVEVIVVRDGEERTFTVTLGEPR